MIEKKFRKLRSFILVFLVGFCCLSMTWNYYDLLSQEDLGLEDFGQSTPALSSAIDSDFYWESFNEWQCFSTESIQFECTELDYGRQYVPTIRISQNNELYDFSLDPEPALNCQKILTKWRSLLEKEDGFCVYAAYLQDLPHDAFEAKGIERWGLWIVDQVKSRKGYWKEQDPL